MRGTARFLGYVGAFLVLASGLSAQDMSLETEWDSVWTANRPDGYAPVGVSQDLILRRGEVRFTYRFDQLNLEGFRAGTDTLTLSEVFADFELVPLEQQVAMHTVGLSYGLNEWVTLSAEVPFVDTNLDLLTDDDVFFESAASGVGDIRATALFSILENGPYRAHLHGGFSIPTGSVDETGASEFSENDPLPYSMQTGSGTFDVLPGMTVSAQNQRGSVGAQVLGTFRLGENDREYRLGHRVDASGWFAVRLNENFSTSLRIATSYVGTVEGIDDALDADASPLNRPDLQGGTRVDLPLGLNIMFPEGRLQGHRLAVEAVWPLHQDLNGPQLERDWGFSLGWQKMFR